MKYLQQADVYTRSIHNLEIRKKGEGRVGEKERQKPACKVEKILDALKDLEYGSLEIIVHDGQVVQIDRTEKKRFATEKKAR
ncbi:YezD family protein [Aneurinibacillus uraniidurans]|uniref:YezD family protein n=1 Tax=Aneurinibacillus uraniidurans TaxID=2966586 RepID=UPI00234B4057|nr:YezD family protein [Aneurinibacillus sp. B1]WCN37219.1 YezD family protein [Aneurinibacillus sp. B1]